MYVQYINLYQTVCLCHSIPSFFKVSVHADVTKMFDDVAT